MSVCVCVSGVYSCHVYSSQVRLQTRLRGYLKEMRVDSGVLDIRHPYGRTTLFREWDLLHYRMLCSVLYILYNSQSHAIYMYIYVSTVTNETWASQLFFLTCTSLFGVFLLEQVSALTHQLIRKSLKCKGLHNTTGASHWHGLKFENTAIWWS